MTLKQLDEGISINTDNLDKIKKIDSIVFDCDGVLIDVSNSYDLTIKKTVDFVINKISHIDQSGIITSKMIQDLKTTGGFNDEVDVSYAMILSLIAAKNKNEPFDTFFSKVVQNADHTGIISVEKYLDSINSNISDVRSSLQYPGKKFDNILSSIFDSIFYGSQLYLQLYKRKSEFYDGPGLIDNDIVLLTNDLMTELHNKFNKKIAIVTGRGLLSASYSLKDFFNSFDIKNSKFLEDEPRELAKPNPISLIDTIHGIQGTTTMYVGDSMEDYMMAKKADEKGHSALFCGVYGTTNDPMAKKRLFETNKADVIVKSIDLIPKTLNLV